MNKNHPRFYQNRKSHFLQMIYIYTDGKNKNITVEEIILNTNARFIARIHVQNKLPRYFYTFLLLEIHKVEH